MSAQETISPPTKERFLESVRALMAISGGNPEALQGFEVTTKPQDGPPKSDLVTLEVFHSLSGEEAVRAFREIARPAKEHEFHVQPGADRDEKVTLCFLVINNFGHTIDQRIAQLANGIDSKTAYLRAYHALDAYCTGLLGKAAMIPNFGGGAFGLEAESNPYVNLHDTRLALEWEAARHLGPTIEQMAADAGMEVIRGNGRLLFSKTDGAKMNAFSEMLEAAAREVPGHAQRHAPRATGGQGWGRGQA